MGKVGPGGNQQTYEKKDKTEGGRGAENAPGLRQGRLPLLHPPRSRRPSAPPSSSTPYPGTPKFWHPTSRAPRRPGTSSRASQYLGRRPPFASQATEVTGTPMSRHTQVKGTPNSRHPMSPASRRPGTATPGHPAGLDPAG